MLFRSRSPEALGVSLYFDDEQQQLYFFDDAVIGAGMFLDTSMMIPAAQEIVGDTEHSVYCAMRMTGA